MRRGLWLLFLTLVSGVFARELVQNGRFELPPDSGWEVIRWGDFPDTGNCRLRWQHSLNPDRDFEVLIHKMLHQGMKLYQKIPVTTLDLWFSVFCRLTAKSEDDSLFAAAAVCLEYLNGADSVLGESRIYSATRGCTWQSGPNLHLLRAPDSLSWHRYRISVRSELESLPGVEPESVKAIRVALLAFVLGNC
ncbi:MAG: hypothetical protein ABIK44_01195 [candidate division WOR-3 bacterium]